MKKSLGIFFCLFIILTVFIPAASYSEELAISGYEPVYILTGFSSEEQLKVQVSFKYDLFSKLKLGLYTAYTQIMFWDLYNFSSPFKEINFYPDIFWRFESGNNFLDDLRIPALDYLQFGMDHKSNGQLENSRGWTRVYGQLQLSVWLQEQFNVGINTKYFYVFDNADNPDIQDYIGSTEVKLFMVLLDEVTKEPGEEVYYRFGFGGGVNGLDITQGWHEIGLKSRALFSRFRPYIQIWHGYCESLVEYNMDKSAQWLNTSVKAGIIIE